MARFILRGKGYKQKLRGMIEAIPAYVWFKGIKSLDRRSRKSIQHQNCENCGNWFITIDEIRSLMMNDTGLMKNNFNEAENIVKRRFHILGAEINFLKEKINWHKDPRSGFQWKKRFYKRLYPVANVFDDSDVKFPYELSRFQHLHAINKAYLQNSNNKYAEETIFQISEWLIDNTCPYGINWTCAMDVSIRACNWIWAWWLFKDHPSWSDEFNNRFLKGIWQHGWYIMRNLEDNDDIRTNHYLSDIVGLLFLGVMFPHFKEAERWQNFGIQELAKCMDEMVYPDGVSFENAIAYHRLALELFTYSAILCGKNNLDLPDKFWERLEKMFEFIMYCIRPDGYMPMIGDADDGRFFIMSDYYDWDRWDFRYLLSIGAVLFKRRDFRKIAGKCHEEVYWLFGNEGVLAWQNL